MQGTRFHGFVFSFFKTSQSCFSEDEFAVGRLNRTAQREITQQLIKDGYNLDLEPDDEDLDLIPPKPLHERCVCCQVPVKPGCKLQ